MIYTHKRIIIVCVSREVFTQNLILAGIIFHIMFIKTRSEKLFLKDVKKT